MRVSSTAIILPFAIVLIREKKFHGQSDTLLIDYTLFYIIISQTLLCRAIWTVKQDFLKSA